MAIVLRNNSGRRQVFELSHDVMCTPDNCFCNRVEQRSRSQNPETGEVGTNTEEVRQARSLVLPAKGVSEPLPDSAANVPAIADAIKRGLLLTDQQEVAAPVPTRTRSGYFPPSGSGSSS